MVMYVSMSVTTVGLRSLFGNRKVKMLNEFPLRHFIQSCFTNKSQFASGESSLVFCRGVNL